MDDALNILMANGLMLEEDSTTPTYLPEMIFPHRFPVKEIEIHAMFDRLAAASGHRFEAWTLAASQDNGAVRPGTLMLCFGNERDAIYAKMFL